MKAGIKQWSFVDPLLRSIALDIEHHFGVEFTITSPYRIDDPGVHGTLPLRGLDLRCPVEGFGILIAKYVNSKYQYDPSRVHKSCCLYHAVAGGAPHIHLQTHPNSIVINQ
jgi:hypothetical protein